MRPRCLLSVAGGNIHTISKERLDALQSVVENLGAQEFPLFLRAGALQRLSMQPVTARALLAEIETSTQRMAGMLVPGLRFLDANGEWLGALFLRPLGGDLAASRTCWLAVTTRGIQLRVDTFPPPVGFRTEDGSEPGKYTCYFERLRVADKVWTGIRTEEMGGSGSPVALPEVPVPPPTRWDLARVSGTAPVAEIDYVEVPVAEAFRDVIHAFVSACTESLRLRRPLEIRLD